MADVPDEKTTLTPNEKKAIGDSWAVIYSTKLESGLALFTRLFKEHPEARKLFKNMSATDDLETLAKGAQLKAHATRVMASLNSVVENVEEADILIQLLQDIGTSHAKHKVPEAYFDALGPVVIWLVENKSGAAYSEFVKASWIKVWGVIKPIMVAALNEASK